MPKSTSVFATKLSFVLMTLLGLATQTSATPLTVLNYTLSANGPIYYGYDDNSYHATGQGNPVAGELSGGVGDLTDGLWGASVAGGYSAWSPYVMWDGVSPKITFDFGTTFHFDAVTFQGTVYNQAAVYSLPSAQFRVSNDGVTYSSIQSAMFSEITGNDVTYGFTVIGNAGLQGRYLEMQLDSPGRWIAISEIQVDGVASGPGGGNSVPESASTALLCLGGCGIIGMVNRRRVIRSAR